jgi:hypothetical protein
MVVLLPVLPRDRRAVREDMVIAQSDTEVKYNDRIWCMSKLDVSTTGSRPALEALGAGS